MYEKGRRTIILLSGLFQKCPDYDLRLIWNYGRNTACWDNSNEQRMWEGYRVPTDKMAGMYSAIRYMIKHYKDRHAPSTWLYEQGTVYSTENLGWPCTQKSKKEKDRTSLTSKRGSDRVPRVLVGNCCDIAREPISTVSMVQRRIRQWPTMTCHGCIIT